MTAFLGGLNPLRQQTKFTDILNLHNKFIAWSEGFCDVTMPVLLMTKQAAIHTTRDIAQPGLAITAGNHLDILYAYLFQHYSKEGI